MEGTTPLRSAVRAQAVQLAGRAMLREILALTPQAISLRGEPEFEFVAMTPDAIVGEMNVAIEGEWLGHPSGPFSMNAEKMQQCVAQFDRLENPLVVDYEHNSVQPGGDGRAAGWIHKLDVRDGEAGAELWATTEWTAKAADMIKSGEYRYCSPVIDFGAKDRATGEHVPVELFNVAITNNPFLDGMHPIALSRVAAAKETEMPDDEQKPADTEEKPPAEGEEEETGKPFKAADETDLPAAEEPATDPDSAEARLSAFVDAVMAASGGSRAAVFDALNTLSDQVGGLVRNRLETTDGSASDAQEIPMSTTQNKGGDAITLALAKQVAALTKQAEEDRAERIAASKKAKAEADAAQEKAHDARIEAMLGDGRLGEGERETARLVLKQNGTLFEAIYGGRKAGEASPVGRRQATNTPGGEAEETTADSDAANPELARAVGKLTEQERRLHAAKTAGKRDPKGEYALATARRILNGRARRVAAN